MGRSFKTNAAAAFKLHVRFTDGGTVNLKSRDWQSKRYQPEMGLLHLEKYVNRHQDKIITAMIYDKRGGGDQLVRHFSGGTWKVSQPLTFT